MVLVNPFQKDAVIVLAAGDSTRMGIPKGLVRFRNRPWIQEQVENLKRLGFEKIVVTLGTDAPRYFAELPGLQEIAVINSSPEEGPFLSLLFGIEAMTPFKPESIWVLPVDVPVPSQAVWNAMADVKGKKVVIPSIQERDALRGGHPVRLSMEWASELLNQRTKEGMASNRLDQAIGLLPATEKTWVMTKDPSIRVNLNTKEEFERYERNSLSN